MARREWLADFADGDLFGTEIARRVDSVSRSYLQALAPGPVALNDPTQGMIYKGWYLRVDNTTQTAYLSESKEDTRLGWEEETELFTWSGDDIREMDFCFDQNGAPFMACERTDGHLWLRYFKPSAGDFVFEDFGVGRCPKCILDDPTNVEDSDILVFYERGGGVRIRSQRDLYVSEETAGIILSSLQHLEGLLRDTQHRVGLIGSTRNPVEGTWELWRETSKLYPIYLEPEGMRTQHRSLLGLVEDVILFYDPVDNLDVGNRAAVGTKVENITLPILILDQPAIGSSVDEVLQTEIVIVYTAQTEETEAENQSIGGTIEDVVILYTAETESIDGVNSSISGTVETP